MQAARAFDGYLKAMRLNFQWHEGSLMPFLWRLVDHSSDPDSPNQASCIAQLSEQHIS